MRKPACSSTGRRNCSMRGPADDTEYLREFTVYFLPSFFFFGGCTDCAATLASDVRLKNNCCATPTKLLVK
jgi:hypothetical protein